VFIARYGLDMIRVVSLQRAVPWLAQLVAGHGTVEDGSDPGSVRIRIVVDTVAMVQVSLPVLRFPLSVSFHQCSILIHSSTTDPV
jgi:hypothetical protein